MGFLSTACEFVPIPTLAGRYKTALTCYPLSDESNGTTNNTYPLHIFAHGNFAGGTRGLNSYKGYLQEIASFGFVVIGFASCPIDSVCHNGQTYMVEALKTVTYLEDHPNLNPHIPVDLRLPYSASGHSTGGRTVLMLAAARDNSKYLQSPAIMDFINLTVRDRRILRKIVAVAGDHPDPMYDHDLNPDVEQYNITLTPTMIVTGTRDTTYTIGEPSYSAWGDFLMMPHLTNKVFLNVAGAYHTQPLGSHSEAKYIAYFSQFHVMGNQTAGRMIYGNNDDDVKGSLFDLWNQRKFVASVGARNNGGIEKEVSFLACGGKSGAVPSQLGEYCTIGLDKDVNAEVQMIDTIRIKEERVFLSGIGVAVATLWLGCWMMRRKIKRYKEKAEEDEMQTLVSNKTSKNNKLYLSFCRPS